jgi:hypothetical protein
MALTKIVIETEIINGDKSVKELQDLKQNAENSVKSLSDLKKEFKTLQDQLTGLTPGTKEYTEALKKLGAVKDQIGDLRSEIEGFAGADKKIAAVTNVIGGLASGFQAAQGAMALFGTENEDLQKALLRVQAAMALTQGLQGLAGMADSLGVVTNLLKSTTVGTYLAAAAQKVYNVVMAANPIGLLIAGLTALVGIIALVVNSMEDENEAQKQVIASREREIEVMDSQMAKFKEESDFRKQLAAAMGKSAEDQLNLSKYYNNEENLLLEEKIKKLKQNISDRIAIIDSANKDEFQQIKDKNAADFKLIEEARKRQRELDKQNKLEQAKFDTDERKKAEEKKKESDDKGKERANKKAEDDAAEREYWRKRRLEEQEAEQFFSDELAEQEKNKKIFREKALQDELELNAKQNDEFNYKLYQEQKKRDEDLLLNKKKAKEQEVQLTLQGLTAIQGLADAFAGKSVESQKRAFQIKKIASIAQATIETYQASQSAYASQMVIPTPDAPIRAAIAAGISVASGLARVAVIAKQQFQAPSTGGGATESNLGSFSQGGGQPPQGLSAQNTVTQLNPDGTVAGQGNREMQPMKAYVVESESRAVTERVNKLSNQSKI